MSAAVVGLLVVKTRVQWVLGQVLAPGGVSWFLPQQALQGCGCPGTGIHLLMGGAGTHDVLGLLPACWVGPGPGISEYTGSVVLESELPAHWCLGLCPGL